MPEPPPDLDARPWRLDAAVRGRVQGVGYRYFVIDEGYRLALTGWVVNELDGSVRCVAEGPRTTLERFLAALWAGPNSARVDSVTVAWSRAAGGLEGFRIRSGGHSGD